MRRTELLATALGAVLLATPVFAQSLTRPIDVSPRPPEHSEAAVPAPATLRQAAPPAAALERDAAREAAAVWVEQAQAALQENRTGQANDLLERAETRLLTRSTPATLADQPMQTPAIRHLAAARAALGARDRTGAEREAGQALAALQATPGSDMMQGEDVGIPPRQGGGGGKAQAPR